MTQAQREWQRACNDLVREIIDLGYPEEFGRDIARILGSPKAIDRMSAYLRYTRPESAEIIADEVLAIRSEIESKHLDVDMVDCAPYTASIFNDAFRDGALGRDLRESTRKFLEAQ